MIKPIPASQITPEAVYRQRRRLIQATLAAPLASLAGCADADSAGDLAPGPERRSPDGEVLTSYRDVTSYNNYYEFGTGKADPARYAHTLKPRPWLVTVAGEAELTGRFEIDDLLKPHAAEERIYRLRCVEGWSMVIPWLGFPLAGLLKRFKPTSRAKFVAFQTLADPEQMPGLRYRALDWPYREGLRIDEATHPLAFMATGLYGQQLPNQNGAPWRLVVPWKYGFKSIKSIVRIEFTESMPATSWNMAQPSEYGFYSNVNPEVDHPRWSQKTERRIAGTASKLFAERIPTLPFNGYADEVAPLYAGMDLRRWF